MSTPYTPTEIALYQAHGLWNTEDNPRIQPLGPNKELHVWDNPSGGVFTKVVDKQGTHLTPSDQLELFLAAFPTERPRRKRK